MNLILNSPNPLAIAMLSRNPMRGIMTRPTRRYWSRESRDNISILHFTDTCNIGIIKRCVPSYAMRCWHCVEMRTVEHTTYFLLAWRTKLLWYPYGGMLLLQMSLPQWPMSLSRLNHMKHLVPQVLHLTIKEGLQIVFSKETWTGIEPIAFCIIANADVPKSLGFM